MERTRTWTADAAKVERERMHGPAGKCKRQQTESLAGKATVGVTVQQAQRAANGKVFHLERHGSSLLRAFQNQRRAWIPPR